MSKPILGYWKIRGSAEAIRMMFHYANVDYENVMYEVTDPPELSPAAWFGVKFTLGLQFPNLPYIINGETKITEAVAVTKYVVNRYASMLAGTTPEETAQLDMLFSLIAELKNSVVMTCYNPEYGNLIDAVFEKNKANWQGVAEFLGEKKFLLGNRLTWVDFWLYETVDMYNAMRPEYLSAISPVFARFKQDFSQVERMGEFLNAPRMKWNNKFAAFQ